MKRIKIARRVLWITVLFLIAYNSYFGWNMKPINHAERVCDWVAQGLFFIWAGFYFSPLFSAYENYINQKE